MADWSQEEFFATGTAEALKFIADLQRVAPSAPRGRALDFGCGVGRLTRALAPHFRTVVGVDVADSMIERARLLNADCTGCSFVVNRSTRLRGIEDRSFDVVYCRLVLQHIRPAIVRLYIPELIRVLAPGGVLMFQLPEGLEVSSRETFEDAPVLGGALKRGLPRPVVVLWRRLKYPFVTGKRGVQMEMYGVNRPEVEAIIRKAGGRLLQVTPDDGHGQIGKGFAYWVVRS